jgi:hypothetical protein
MVFYDYARGCEGRAWKHSQPMTEITAQDEPLEKSKRVLRGQAKAGLSCKPVLDRFVQTQFTHTAG